MSVSVLLAGVGSAPPAPSSVALAVLVSEFTPAATVLSTRTVTVRVTLVRAARPPTFQVTTPPEKMPPSEALTKVVLAGRVSVTVTPVASWAPALLIVTV